jgi:hypothetical protein
MTTLAPRLTKHALEGEYSTVILPDGIIETLLFHKDGTTIARRTYSIGKTHTDHIASIQAELEEQEARA